MLYCGLCPMKPAIFPAMGRIKVYACIAARGETRAHASDQPHSMITRDQAIFTYVLWRGNGLADLPQMVKG